MRYLREHSANDNKRYYYKIRDTYNRRGPSAAQAARFIYLNRTCFNGIFRVNLKGEFNVPYGRYKGKRTTFPSRDKLLLASEALNGAKIAVRTFQESIRLVRPNAFVYLDPPYPPLNGTSFFAHYTPDRFNYDLQIELSECVADLDARGCQFMMTNADTRAIRRLYRGFNIRKLSVVRYISCKSKKHKVNELIIANYDLDGL